MTGLRIFGLNYDKTELCIRKKRPSFLIVDKQGYSLLLSGTFHLSTITRIEHGLKRTKEVSLVIFFRTFCYPPNKNIQKHTNHFHNSNTTYGGNCKVEKRTMSILIKNSTILTQDDSRRKIQGDLYIDDHVIVEVSEKPLTIEAEYKINGAHKLVLPGLVNTHTHIPMTLFRGYGDDMLLQDWLTQRIWPVEAKLTKDAVEVGTRLGLLEMISSGTTSYADMYFFEETIAKTTEKIGMRGFLGFALIDFDTPEFSSKELIPQAEQFLRRWKKHPLISPLIAPHSTYSCKPETLQKARELATKHQVPLHIHCSETRDEVYDVEKKYGVRPVEQLKKYGLLQNQTILAHCGWITKNEIIDMKNAGVTVAHCPVSNMKIASGGFAPVPELLDAFVPVGLGTDGAASNNTLDMVETMKFCALIHKNHRWDPTVLPAQTVVDLATRGGAAALGVSHIIGSLEEGKTADLIMIDLDKPHLTPLHDPVSHLVYAVRGTDVCTTIVNGAPLLLDKKYLTIDLEKTLEQAKKIALELTS
jgi:5-methylthioadenosine/S-adenosylhomocysteine deaminase